MKIWLEKVVVAVAVAGPVRAITPRAQPLPLMQVEVVVPISTRAPEFLDLLVTSIVQMGCMYSTAQHFTSCS